MNLYESWFNKAYTKDGGINNLFWNDFVPKEQKIYEYILSEKVEKIEGSVKELAEKFDMSPEYFTGFIDGINDTQEEKIVLQDLTEDSQICIKINFEVLYRKMVEYKADHLYNLPEWKNIFTEEQLKTLFRGQRSSTTFIREPKIERNDPCPCGSGKKYKKCCGAN
ncbi:SEC-C metal-binding domain-containing protein [[Clostridium] colinum]|uniref:SEC-C metal-binding domain-containing protein n=1 Tax=[Clostridium] colinum TaxID=36835 RepID=UPI002023CC14|nr:SEC-C metal-binding domain-containing protein [[Clostridium] colinum]